MNHSDLLTKLGQSRPATIRFKALGANWGRKSNPQRRPSCVAQRLAVPDQYHNALVRSLAFVSAAPASMTYEALMPRSHSLIMQYYSIEWLYVQGAF